MKWLSFVTGICLTTAICVGQQTVTADRYLVVSGHELATDAGLEVLRGGGNAMDAAVTVSMCLGVVEPYGSGLGGKLVMLYYDASTEQVYCVEALCKSSDELDVDEFKALARKDRRQGYTSVAVPGMLAGLHDAFERWGSGSWEALVEPAARLAEEGYPVSKQSLVMFKPKVAVLRSDPEAARLYLRDNELPKADSVLRFPELAATLRSIASEGPGAFYRGPIADRIVSTAQAHGSPMTLEDLRDYRPNHTKPLSIEYAGVTVYSSPPPLTGGVTVLMALKALDEHDWADYGARDASTIHRVCSVLRGVYPQVTKSIGDHELAQSRALAILKTTNTRAIYQQSLEASIPSPAGMPPTTNGTDNDRVPESSADASTTHFIVVDAEGNWASVTQSLSYHFGAGVVVPTTGILLNNSMNNFSTTSSTSVNRISPGKRPRSTVAPILILRDGRPVLALGIPGGQRIPTTSIQLLMDMLVFGLEPAESFGLPRYHVRRPRSTTERANALDLEGGSPPQLADRLTKMGWSISLKPNDGRYFGGGSAAVALPDGPLVGVADLRRTNHAGGK